VSNLQRAAALRAFDHWLEQPLRSDYAQHAGPLAGLTFAVKDNFDVAGLPTGAGCRRPVIPVAQVSAPLVTRLLTAGATLVGKTTMTEFAFGGWGTNRSLGTPRNPADTQLHRVPGGSSSGSAVAVAASLVDFALGSDTGGSVRIPAALCGVVGLRPSPGRASVQGLIPLAPSLDIAGPLARTVREIAAVFEVMQEDSSKRFVAARALARPVRGLRLAVLSADDLAACETAVADAYVDAIGELAAAGAKIVERTWPRSLDALASPVGTLLGYEAWRSLRHWVEPRSDELDPCVRQRFEAGARISRAVYESTLVAREHDTASFQAWLADFDACVSPTVPCAAPPLESVDEGSTAAAAFTRAVGYLGLAALSVPVRNPGGALPIGLQIVTLPWQEETAIAVATCVEAGKYGAVLRTSSALR